MTRRLALVALWLAATTFAVLLATFAVRLAGDKVVAQGPATVSRDQVEESLTAVPTSAGTAAPAPATSAPVIEPALPTTEPPPTRPGAAGPGPDGSPTTVGAAAIPVPAEDTSATTVIVGAPPITEPTPVASPEPPSSEQSFVLVGGSVRVRCVGAAASLLWSNPNPGFAMDVRSEGPREVEVRFSASGRTSELKASCADGQISAEPKESGDGDGDGDG